MANYRIRRINDEMTRELCRIIRNVKDPRVSGSLTTVTGCDVSPDLKNAKVYFSVMGERRKGDALKGLENATGYIRTQIAKMLNLRITPELTFVPDTSVEYGAKISKILKTINEEEK